MLAALVGGPLGVGFGLHRRAGAPGGGAISLDADFDYQAATVEVDPVAGRYASWANDPASAMRVGRWRKDGIDVAFASIFSFGRTTGGTDIDAAGAIASFAAAQPRIGFTAGVPVGMLLEGAASNYVPNSLAGTGFSQGASGNTVEISADIAPNYPGAGVVKITRGDTTTFPDNNCGNITVGTPGASNTITISCWMYVTSAYAGTNGNLHPTIDTNAGVIASRAYDLGSRNTWQRVWRTLTTTAGQTGILAAQMRLASAVTGDFVYCCMFQCEISSVPTSTIETTGSAVQRTVEQLTIGGATLLSLLGGSNAAGCVIAEVLLDSAMATGAFRPIIQLEDSGGTQQKLEARPNSSQTGIIIVPTTNGSQGAASAGAGAPVYGTPMRVGLRWSTAQASASMNGGAVITLGGTPPTGFATLRLGGNASGGNIGMNGRIRRLLLLPTPPDDTAFRALTTLGA